MFREKSDYCVIEYFKTARARVSLSRECKTQFHAHASSLLRNRITFSSPALFRSNSIKQSCHQTRAKSIRICENQNRISRRKEREREEKFTTWLSIGRLIHGSRVIYVYGTRGKSLDRRCHDLMRSLTLSRFLIDREKFHSSEPGVVEALI